MNLAQNIAALILIVLALPPTIPPDAVPLTPTVERINPITVKIDHIAYGHTTPYAIDATHINGTPLGDGVFWDNTQYYRLRPYVEYTIEYSWREPAIDMDGDGVLNADELHDYIWSGGVGTVQLPWTARDSYVWALFNLRYWQEETRRAFVAWTPSSLADVQAVDDEVASMMADEIFVPSTPILDLDLEHWRDMESSRFMGGEDSYFAPWMSED